MNIPLRKLWIDKNELLEIKEVLNSGCITTGPAIKSFQKNGANLSKASQILFEVKDSITSVKSFSGWLDGKWISFEQHSRKFFYNFDSHCVKGKHELVFKAADENGNESVYKLNFTR